MRRVVAGLAVPLLLLTTTSCGDSKDTDAAADGTTDATTAAGDATEVAVSGDPGEAPTVDFKAPLSFDSSAGEIVDEGPGTGDAITATSTVTLDYVAFNANDATELDNSFTTGTPATFGLSEVLPGLAIGLTDAHAGDRVLLTIASKDGFDPAGNGSTVKAGDSLIFVADVVEVTNPVAIPRAQLPTLQEDKQGLPQLFVTKADTPKDVGLLGVYPVKKGTGPAVTAGQTLTVNYLGQLWPDGAVFDESYSEKPVSFPLDNVIPGWQQGLVGQTVGSRVILTIPSDLAYGPRGQGETIPPDSDLIFLIDIQKAV